MRWPGQACRTAKFRQLRLVSCAVPARASSLASRVAAHVRAVSAPHICRERCASHTQHGHGRALLQGAALEHLANLSIDCIPTGCVASLSARLRSQTLPQPKYLFGPACPPSSACRGTPSGGPIGKLQESSTSCAQLLSAPAFSLSGLTTFVQLIISPIELKMLPASRWMPSEVRVHLPAARSARS